MIRQKLIYYREMAQLSASVESLSMDGWRVVPGTQFIVAVAGQHVGIVMEKDVDAEMEMEKEVETEAEECE